MIMVGDSRVGGHDGIVGAEIVQGATAQFVDVGYRTPE